MLALAGWLREYGRSLVKVYVTYRLPSSKGNVSGGLSMLRQSGWDYTWLKVWVNRVAPMRLRRAGLPASVADYLAALGLSVPVEAVDSVKTPEILAELAALSPDLLVSFSATQRFPDALIDIPSVGAINVHYGALPRYAGLSPYYWHLHNEEADFGVTLHRIEPKLDAGGIVEQSIRSVGRQNTCLGLMLDMAGQVSPLLNRFQSGETSLAHLTEQDPAGRTYFRHPTRSQVKDFRLRGYRMMDADSRKRLLDMVQACRPGK